MKQRKRLVKSVYQAKCEAKRNRFFADINWRDCQERGNCWILKFIDQFLKVVERTLRSS